MIECAWLTLPSREVIEKVHAHGHDQKAIAAAVKIDQITGFRELPRRPVTNPARPCHAQAQ